MAAAAVVPCGALNGVWVAAGLEMRRPTRSMSSGGRSSDGCYELLFDYFYNIAG